MKNVGHYKFSGELKDQELTIEILTFVGEPSRFIGRFTPENIPR